MTVARRSDAWSSNVPPAEPGFVAVALVGAGGRTRYISPSIEELLGFTSEEIGARPGFSVLHPEDRMIAVAVLGALAESRDVHIRSEVRCMHRDGSVRRIECLRVNRLHDPSIGAIVLSLRAAGSHVAG